MFMVLILAIVLVIQAPLLEICLDMPVPWEALIPFGQSGIAREFN